MKEHFFRRIALFLALWTVLTSFPSCTEKGRTEAELIVPDATWRIISPDLPLTVRDLAFTLQDSLLERFGYLSEVISTKDSTGEKEMIVGTNAQLPANVEKLMAGEYLILQSENTIYLCGYGTGEISLCITDFLNRLSEGKGIEKNFVFRKEANNLLIAEDGKTNYCIVFPRGDEVCTSLAERLQAGILQKCGARLEIGQDVMPDYCDGDGNLLNEILIGNTNRTAGKNAFSALDGAKDWTASVIGNTVVLGGKSDAANRSAVEYFIKTFVSAADGNFLPVQTDLYHIVRHSYLNGEKEAENFVGNIRSGAKNLVAGSVEVADVYTPPAYDGTDGGDYFALYANMASFKNRIYTVWAQGKRNEDDQGQQIFISSCDENNFVWSEPWIAVERTKGENVEWDMTYFAPVLFSNGEKLVLFYSSILWKRDQITVDGGGNYVRPGTEAPNANYGAKNLYRKVSEDGIHWSDAELLFENGQICANDAPVRVGDRLLWACNRTVLCSDEIDGTGDFRVLATIDASPAISAGGTLMESGLFERGGIVYMTFRSNLGVLWLSTSRDGGNTWSKVFETCFTDADTLCKFLKTDEGEVYYVGCLNPDDRYRDTLYLCIADSGTAFERQYRLRTKNDNTYTLTAENGVQLPTNASGNPVNCMPGIAKGCSWNYPDILISGGYLYVAYTVYKEKVEVIRIPTEVFE